MDPPQTILEIPPKTSKEKPLSTYTQLLETLSSFLTISIHSILHARSLYPPNTFLLTRAYNYPVYQNRHPVVCKWIGDAVRAVMGCVEGGRVERVGVVVIDPNGDRGKGVGKGEVRVLERYVFDLSRWLVLGSGSREDWNVEIEREGEGEGTGKEISMVDVEEALRGAVGRLAMVGGKLGPLPKGCTFSVVVELKDGGQEVGGVIGHPQPWIPSNPSLQPGKGRNERMGRELGGVKCTPVRAVEVGEFVMEMWVEEGKAKFPDSSCE